MIHCLKLPVRFALACSFASFTFASFTMVAACGDPAETAFLDSEAQLVSETHALAACGDEPGCNEEPPEQEGGWVSRCSSDVECSVGACVCGVCTEACGGEADACSGLPEGAACFAGRSLPRAALCHATTVPGICLLPCDADAECGEGLVCALGACLPEPARSTAP